MKIDESDDNEIVLNMTSFPFFIVPYINFIEAMKRGIVKPEGQAGIKRLSAGTRIGGQLFTYEVKVFGQFANYRFYGNYNEELGVIVFTLFGKALH